MAQTSKEEMKAQTSTETGITLAPRCYSIIDSVKGGSGKTSLSLMLTLAAQKYMQEKSPSSDAKNILHSLLLDMDMQGSSLDYLLFEGGRSTDEAISNRASNTLNDAILHYYRRERPRFISTPEFFFADEFEEWFNVEEPASGNDEYRKSYQIAAALASRRIDDRDRFRAVSRMNYSSQITYDAFGSGLRAILKKSNLNSYLPDQLRYIFFDMPPNSNGYSDCVLDLLLSPNSSSAVSPGCPRNYFELMTLDQGHIEATLDWFEQFVTQGQHHFPDHFFFVFSNVSPLIDPMEMEYDMVKRSLKKGPLSEAIQGIQNRLDKLSLTHRNRSRIYFVGVSYQLEYLRRCCRFGSLLSSKSGEPLNPKMLSPIKFLIYPDGAYFEDYTDGLLKLICTKDPES